MPIDHECPECYKAFRFPDEARGRTVECLKCGTRFRVPAATERTGTIELAAPVGCPGCGRYLEPGAISCGACGYNNRTKKRPVVRVTEKELRFADLTSPITDVRFYVRRSDRGQWTLTVRDFLLFFIPLGRRRVFPLRHYRAAAFNYADEYVTGRRASGHTIHVYLVSAAGQRMHLWTCDSPKDAAWFRDALCGAAGLEYEQFS